MSIQGTVLWLGYVSLGVLLAPPAFAQGGWYIAPDYTFTLPDSGTFHGSSSSLGLSFGKRFLNGPDLELSYGAQELSFGKGLGTLKRNDLTAGARWRPDDEMPGFYLSLGAGAARLSHDQDIYLAPTAYAGLGYSLSIPGTTHFDLLNEARVRYTRDNDLSKGQDIVDGQAIVKVRYSTPLTQPTGPVTPAPVSSNAGATAGVGDAPAARSVSLRDTCKSMQVDSDNYRSYRCEVFEDEDGDGVPDGKDVCRDTIAGVQVDDDGCMMSGRK